MAGLKLRVNVMFGLLVGRLQLINHILVKYTLEN